MSSGYRIAGKIIGAGARTGTGMGRALGDALHNAQVGRRRGPAVLPPGSGPPPPTVRNDYLDYRGAADWRDARDLEQGAFPLGHYVDLAKGKLRGPIGMPADAINRHAVAVGPTGSGKTFGLIVPWIYAALKHGWSVVAIDVTGRLQDDVLAYRDSLGVGPLGARVRQWDFTDPSRSHTWQWLSELTDTARVDAAVTAILGRREDSRGTDPFYYRRDYRTLRGLLQFTNACAPTAATAGDLLRILERDRALDAAVQRHPRAPGASDLEPILRFPPADWPKIISGVVAALAAFDNPGANTVTAATPGTKRLELAQALDEHQLLTVVAPLKAGEVSATLSSLILNQLTQRIYERYGGSHRPVLLVVDEAPQVADRVDLTRILEVGRRAGVGALLAMQDVAQLKDEDERSTVLSNAATLALMPGSSAKSAEELQKRLGHRPEQVVNLSDGRPTGKFGSGRMDRSWSTQQVPVLGDREIMQPPSSGRPAIVHVKAPELGITGRPLLVDLAR